jgi:hypothetical protein
MFSYGNALCCGFSFIKTGSAIPELTRIHKLKPNEIGFIGFAGKNWDKVSQTRRIKASGTNKDQPGLAGDLGKAEMKRN